VGHAHLPLVALLVLSPRKIMTVHFSPGSFGIEKVLKHQKHGKREFSGSQKLNATNRDFVRKSHKLSKICKNINITMQITFQYYKMHVPTPPSLNPYLSSSK
jgi:hypothetical protein